MTVQAIDVIEVISGADAPLTQSVPGYFFKADQVRVWLVDIVDGNIVETPLVSGVDYTLTTSKVAGSNPPHYIGSVTTVSDIAAAQHIAIMVWPLNEQITDFSAIPHNPADYEHQHDLSAIRDQSLLEILKRSPRLPFTYQGEQLLIDAPQAGKILIAREDGKGWENGLNAGDISSAQSYAESAIAAKNLAEDFSEAAEAFALAAAGTPSYVTKTPVKALAAISNQTVLIIENGKARLWSFNSGDLSARVTADAREGMTFAPDSDATGASGAWVSQHTGNRKLSWFVQSGDVEHSEAINAAFFDAPIGGVTVESDVAGVKIVAENVNLPEGCLFLGPLANPGEMLPGATADYDGLAGVLQIDSARTFNVSERSTVEGFVVMNNNLDLPFADATAATSGVAAFAGKAFTVTGPDATFRDLLIMGFEFAIHSDGKERVRCYNVYGDCTNGIYIEESYDVAYVSDCHFWPYTTVHQSWTTNALLRRNGTAFKFANVGDWTKVTDCFCYGYFRGFWSAACNEMNFVNCGADNTSTAGVGDHAGAFGFVATNGSKRTKFQSCQTAAQQVGYYIDISAGNIAFFNNSTAWATQTSGVQVVSGDVTVCGGELDGGQYGVYINVAASKVDIDLTSFKNQTVRPVLCAASNSNVRFGLLNKVSGFSGAAVAGGVLPTIASADPLAIPPEGDAFFVSGTTNFGNISGMWAKRKISLIFQGALTVTHSSGGIVLSGGTNFAITAGDSLSLLGKSGTAANEIGRSNV